MKKFKILLAGGLYFFCPQLAFSHVKWFAPFDTQQSAQSTESLLSTPYFQLAFLGALGGLFFVIYIDARLRKVNISFHNFRLHKLQALPDTWMYRVYTVTLLVLFSALWTIGDVVLTPELKHTSLFVAGVQLLIIVCTTNIRTAWISGIGIYILWIYSVFQYGVFHVADYVFFLSTAFYMIKGRKQPDHNSVNFAIIALYIGLVWTMQWGTMEKWSFPDWFYPLLADRQYLLMGFEPDSYVAIAGVVEFSLAFLLLSLSGVLLSIVSLGLAGIFVLAIIEFGKIDAIGHLLIVVGLVVIAINGPTRLNLWFENIDSRPVVRAAKTIGIYIVSLCFIFLIYNLLSTVTILQGKYPDVFLGAVRAFLIFIHLLLFAVAFSLILWSEVILLKKGVDSAPIKLVTDVKVVTLFLLWVTGILVVYIDTQFDYQLSFESPKLVIKLLCVSVLSLNGVFLYSYCFTQLAKLGRLNRRHAKLVSICWAISITNWLFAVFLGGSAGLDQISLGNWLTVYAALLCVAILLGTATSETIRTRINWVHERERLYEQNVKQQNLKLCTKKHSRRAA